jgi:hypothetical protein
LAASLVLEHPLERCSLVSLLIVEPNVLARRQRRSLLLSQAV